MQRLLPFLHSNIASILIRSCGSFVLMSLQDHSAPGASAGFNYQFERAMHWLAQSQSGAHVGIETADDVAITQPNGTLTLEQDKHSIRDDGVPYGDRSKDLWNTLNTWLTALESGEISADTTAFFLVTNKVLPDCLAKKIAASKTSSEADACVQEMIAAVKDPPEGIAAHCQRVLRATSRSHLQDLILKIELLDGSAGPSLRATTISFLQIPDGHKDAATSIADELLGWMHTEALLAWQGQKPAWISRDHFVNRLHAALEQRRRKIARERSEHLLPIPTEDVGKELGRPFVRQLNHITDDDGVVDGSIKDFLRCNLEKMRLSREGNITDEDWLAFEAALQSRWDRIQARVKRTSGGKPGEDQGWEIFSDTAEEHREKLAGQDTEQLYLTAGSYHRLADALALGWHPNWKSLMAKQDLS